MLPLKVYKLFVAQSVGPIYSYTRQGSLAENSQLSVVGSADLKG